MTTMQDTLTGRAILLSVVTPSGPAKLEGRITADHGHKVSVKLEDGRLMNLESSRLGETWKLLPRGA